jgi:hypothetical protein
MSWGSYSVDNGGSGHGDKVTNAKVKCVWNFGPTLHTSLWHVAYLQGQLYLLPSELFGRENILVK